MNQLYELGNDKTAALLPSTKPLTSSKELSLLLKQVKANFSAQDLTAETAALWLDAWAELAAQHGIDLLRESLQRHCRTQRFLPLPADVRDGILQIKQERTQAAAEAAATSWTVDKYREARDFDLYLAEKVSEGKTREEVLRNFPGLGPVWSAWTNQRAAGTLRCPAWCETCSGDRFLFEERNGRRQARACPDCRA